MYYKKQSKAKQTKAKQSKNNMPHLKKTPTTNKKKNKQLQKQKNNEEAKKKQLEEEFSWINDEKSSENYKFARTFNAKVFQYFKNNMIMFKIGGKEEESVASKMRAKFKKGVDKAENYGIMPFRGDKYMINLEYYRKMGEVINDIVKVPRDCSAEGVNVKDIIINLTLNNPKPNGEIDNFSIGFLGSVWIDTKDYTGKMYRLAFYNNGEKDYGKGFKPSIMFMDY